MARATEMDLTLLDDDPWGITFEGQLVRLDPAALAWTGYIDLGTCGCANVLAGPDRLDVGAGDRFYVVSP